MNGLRMLANAHADGELTRGNSEDGLGPSSPSSEEGRNVGLMSYGGTVARTNFEKNVYANPETWNLLNRDPEQVQDKNLLEQAYRETLWITIKGIAAGMQNTGQDTRVHGAALHDSSFFSRWGCDVPDFPRTFIAVARLMATDRIYC
eukprot:TRINITY_DN7970_c0_g1_i1.p1 TRINITY_DN7970_c0_g1~~TRINITY_DN7970_c0_g1_i1.p1  ORF type:complete len:147 (+),score=18.28 TRINITY_DN7970_c0_g1_i1:168-608(+)